MPLFRKNDENPACQEVFNFIQHIDFYEKFIKTTSKVPKMVYKEAYLQLPVIFSCFPTKINQSQSVFFRNRKSKFNGLLYH